MRVSTHTNEFVDTETLQTVMAAAGSTPCLCDCWPVVGQKTSASDVRIYGSLNSSTIAIYVKWWRLNHAISAEHGGRIADRTISKSNVTRKYMNWKWETFNDNSLLIIPIRNYLLHIYMVSSLLRRKLHRFRLFVEWKKNTWKSLPKTEREMPILSVLGPLPNLGGNGESKLVPCSPFDRPAANLKLDH